MSLKKTTNRNVGKKEADLTKSWCHNFNPEDQGNTESGPLVSNIDLKKEDPVFGRLVSVRETDIHLHKVEVNEYSEVEIALEKAYDVSPIDRPRMIFNIAKHMKTASPLDNLKTFLDRSLELDYITKSQQEEILKIIE